MAIQFYPSPGTVLVCDFDGVPPEMVKRRPVIVVSPRLRNRGNLVTVVPLSSTRPGDVCEYHHKLEIDPPLPAPYNDPFHWVKADMICTVAFQRLSVLVVGKDASGKRINDQRVIDPSDLKLIRACLLHGLGFGGLTQHL